MRARLPWFLTTIAAAALLLPACTSWRYLKRASAKPFLRQHEITVEPFEVSGDKPVDPAFHAAFTREVIDETAGDLPGLAFLLVDAPAAEEGAAAKPAKKRRKKRPKRRDAVVDPAPSGQDTRLTLRGRCSFRDVLHPVAHYRLGMEGTLKLQVYRGATLIEEVVLVESGRMAGIESVDMGEEFHEQRYGIMFDTAENLGHAVADYIAARGG